MKRITFCLLSLALFNLAEADVEMTIKDGFGDSSTFSSNGQLVRIEGRKIPGFIIIDYASGEFFMVDSKRNQIIKISLDRVNVAIDAATLKVSLKDEGGGQKIAGYLTRKFQLVADGERCGAVYASSKLLKDNNVRAIFESTRNMQQFSRGMMGGMSENIPVCQRANMQLADVIESSGAPLRVVDKAGKLLSEVLAIDTQKKFANNHYELPGDMEVVEVSEDMNRAARKTQEMMKQMQQGDGQMNEEMQQQMKQMLEQLQQQQQ